MKKEREYLKIIIINFFILYVISSFSLWIIFKFRYNLTPNKWELIFGFAFVFSFSQIILVAYSTKYEVLKISIGSTKDIEKMNKFLSSNKIKLIYSSIDTRIYKIKTKYSLIPLKFSISEKESNYLIVLPKIIIPKILDD